MTRPFTTFQIMAGVVFLSWRGGAHLQAHVLAVSHRRASAGRRAGAATHLLDLVLAQEGDVVADPKRNETRKVDGLVEEEGAVHENRELVVAGQQLVPAALDRRHAAAVRTPKVRRRPMSGRDLGGGSVRWQQAARTAGARSRALAAPAPSRRRGRLSRRARRLRGALRGRSGCRSVCGGGSPDRRPTSAVATFLVRVSPDITNAARCHRRPPRSLPLPASVSRRQQLPCTAARRQAAAAAAVDGPSRNYGRPEVDDVIAGLF